MATAKATDAANDADRLLYPYFTLRKALEVAEAVKDLGGVNGSVSKSLIAKHLKVDENSTGLLGVLGAARLYLLLDGRGSYRLTEIAKRYFLPTADDDARRAKLEMVNGPPLYAKLIERFDGTKLPAQEMLVNVLQKDYRVPESWKVRAVTLFLSSLREAQAVDDAGFLRFRSSLEVNENGKMAAMSTIAEQPLTPSVPAAPMADRQSMDKPRGGIAGWTYKGIRVEVPENITMDLWKKLSDYVNVLKPEEE